MLHVGVDLIKPDLLTTLALDFLEPDGAVGLVRHGWLRGRRLVLLVVVERVAAVVSVGRASGTGAAGAGPLGVEERGGAGAGVRPVGGGRRGGWGRVLLTRLPSASAVSTALPPRGERLPGVHRQHNHQQQTQERDTHDCEPVSSPH